MVLINQNKLTNNSMKKIFLLTLGLFYVCVGFSQSLYKGLVYDMSKKEAYKEFKRNKAEYTNIQLGNGVAWRMYKQNFHFYNDVLKGIILTPKGGALGMSNSNGEVYLNNTYKFLRGKGYSVLRKPEYWNIPILFDQHNTYGIVLVNPDKTTTIELRPRRLSYDKCTILMVINNYQNFISGVNIENKIVKEQQSNTGF